MWERRELKGRAKMVLSSCLWSAVIVCLISGILAGEFGSRGSNSNTSQSVVTEDSYQLSDALLPGGVDTEGLGQQAGVSIAGVLTAGLAPLIIYFGIGIFIVALIISIFVGFPILVGSKRFFMCSRERKVGIGTILYAYGSGNMINVVFVQFLQAVKTFLWTLLLVIPGIIKGYEYRMIPYILSENPGIDQRRAFELSRAMMTGQKWNAFVLDLSFFLWYLLGAITCGLANVFYVNPYIAATNAELYAVLRADLINRGVSNTYELPGFSEYANE